MCHHCRWGCLQPLCGYLIDAPCAVSLPLGPLSRWLCMLVSSGSAGPHRQAEGCQGCIRAQGARFDYTLLDRKGSAGWNLAQKLLCRRNSLNRGRLDASAALRHRYFLPEF